MGGIPWVMIALEGLSDEAAWLAGVDSFAPAPTTDAEVEATVMKAVLAATASVALDGAMEPVELQVALGRLCKVAV